MAILAPAMFFLIGMLLYGGRIAIADQSVQQAAEQAAREASIARDAGTAQSLALAGAKASLKQQDLDCVSLNVTVDLGGFSTPAGTASKVTAHVTCHLRTSDLTFVPGVPGSKSLSSSAASPVDTYRER